MNIQITGDNIDISPKIKKLVETKVTQKLDKLLHDFDEQMKTASMRIERDKLGHYMVNFDMVLPGKKQIFSKNSHINLIAALTGLREQLEKQIKRYKSELVNYSVG